MKELDDFTVERLTELSTRENLPEVAALARIALAAKRAEQMLNYPVIPDGWVMVPVEPTEEMCDVQHIGVDVYTGIANDGGYYSIGGDDAAKVYRAMLAAAPEGGNDA